MRLIGANGGKTSVIAVLGIGLVMGLLLSQMPLPTKVKEQLSDIRVKFEDGLEIIKTKTYTISTDITWTEITAAGLKITETTLNGFLQICERLALNLGNLKIYADIEARLMWVYSPSENTDAQVYYVQFT